MLIKIAKILKKILILTSLFWQPWTLCRVTVPGLALMDWGYGWHVCPTFEALWQCERWWLGVLLEVTGDPQKGLIQSCGTSVSSQDRGCFKSKAEPSLSSIFLSHGNFPSVHTSHYDTFHWSWAHAGIASLNLQNCELNNPLFFIHTQNVLAV
jgi:hypothetical protein